MKQLFLFSMLICLLSTTACNRSFDKEAWLNADPQAVRSKRWKMIGDLKKNHLKIGMHRSEVIELLGTPHYEAIQKRVPDDIPKLEPLSNKRYSDQSPKEREVARRRYQDWHDANGISYTILDYPIGFRIIDMVALEFWLDDQMNVVHYRLNEN